MHAYAVDPLRQIQATKKTVNKQTKNFLYLKLQISVSSAFSY